MFRNALISMLLWSAFSTCTSAQEKDSRVLRLKSEVLTLKDVFDAGLRPRLIPSLEMALCKIADEEFSFSVDSRPPIQIAAEWAKFDVNANDEVTTFEARDRNLYTLDEVLEIAEEHLRTLGIGTEKLAEWEARQRAGIRKAATGPGPFIGAGNFSDGKWYGDRNMKAGVKIMSTYQVQAPFTLQYYAQWRSVLSMKAIRREPIKPPAGYEHVSMAPYPSSNDAPSGVEESPEEEPSMVAERPEPENKPPLNPQENQNADDTSSVWPYLLVAAALVGIAVIVLRSRKGKTG